MARRCVITGKGVLAGNNVSHANTQVLDELDQPRHESETVNRAGGTPQQKMILKPPWVETNTKAATLWISSAESCPLNGGIAPPPFSTCVTMLS